MNNKIFGDPRSIKHTGNKPDPHRVAARLEGVVKNAGIKPGKKKPQHEK